MSGIGPVVKRAVGERTAEARASQIGSQINYTESLSKGWNFRNKEQRCKNNN